MATHILLGTANGLSVLDPDGNVRREAFAGHRVDALARDAKRTWLIADGKTIKTLEGTRERDVASVDGLPATCLAVTSSGLMVGTEQAHVFKLDGDRLVPVESFDIVDEREKWYTPWGDPADVRSIAVEPSGPRRAIYVNVHVGGVVRSTDDGRSWTPTLDIDVDVHQVITHPTRRGVVLVAAADGFGESRDGGATWTFSTAGMHAHYLRAVAVAASAADGAVDTVLVSASSGPGGKRSAIYRRPVDDTKAKFERCRTGLPEWFNDNIDTACLAASGRLVVFGTEDGRVFRSRDTGETWDEIAKDLPAIHCAAIA